MTEINVPRDLRDRVTAGWELSTSTRIDLDGAEFWAGVADADEKMARLWHEVRRAVRPDAESVLGKVLLDAESYRHTQARQARDRVREAARHG